MAAAEGNQASCLTRYKHWKGEVLCVVERRAKVEMWSRVSGERRETCALRFASFLHSILDHQRQPCTRVNPRIGPSPTTCCSISCRLCRSPPPRPGTFTSTSTLRLCHCRLICRGIRTKTVHLPMSDVIEYDLPDSLEIYVYNARNSNANGHRFTCSLTKQ